jgi:phospholipase/carboxylesterase
MAFSGFIPTVEGWAPDLKSRKGMPVFIAHGRGDQMISIDFAHRARTELHAAGLDVEYLETGASHQIDPAVLGPAIGWLAARV